MVEDKNKIPDKTRPMNILLAEDNTADVKIILEAFAKAKLKNKVYVTSNGEEALDFIYHKNKFSDENLFPRPDLIILDIIMPKVDGFVVLEKIKNDPGYSSIPVIILTCSKEEENTAKSFKGGACAYISKSDDPQEFSRAVEGFDFFWHAIHRIGG